MDNRRISLFIIYKNAIEHSKGWSFLGSAHTARHYLPHLGNNNFITDSRADKTKSIDLLYLLRNYIY
jgi:hypothetical protein